MNLLPILTIAPIPDPARRTPTSPLPQSRRRRHPFLPTANRRLFEDGDGNMTHVTSTVHGRLPWPLARADCAQPDGSHPHRRRAAAAYGNVSRASQQKTGRYAATNTSITPSEDHATAGGREMVPLLVPNNNAPPHSLTDGLSWLRTEHGSPPQLTGRQPLPI